MHKFLLNLYCQTRFGFRLPLLTRMKNHANLCDESEVMSAHLSTHGAVHGKNHPIKIETMQSQGHAKIYLVGPASL